MGARPKGEAMSDIHQSSNGAIVLPEELQAKTERAQAKASDPNASVWVSANAGAGKTHVLKMRVLRLLLNGTPPERILCLTFTKAAAAEMAQRVFAELAEWTIAPEGKLAGDLQKLLGHAPNANETRKARQLFARAIETPGGLKVQTIHAFCERLLQRFPLEAGIPPGFSILDDETGAALKRSAIDRTLVEATKNATAPLGRALETAVAWAADEQFDLLLNSALSRRGWLDEMSRLNVARGGDSFVHADAIYRQIFEVRPDIEVADLHAEMADILPVAQLRAGASLLIDGGKNDQVLSDRLDRAGKTSAPKRRVRILEDAFLTAQKSPRSDRVFVSKAKKAENPGMADALLSARDRFFELYQERSALGVVEATVALLRLADRVMFHYRVGKDRQAALDYDDLIVRTAHLLSRPDAAGWVLFKLDGGLDHILVDEAQDTSPAQWSIVEALASEFFSASKSLRTVFAVGDEKQSIYGFQGAAPKMFAETGKRFRALSENAALPWNFVRLRLSFRTVSPLLKAIDTIFSDASQTPGLMTMAGAVEHIALRVGQAGRVEVWPTEKPAEIKAAPAFSPLDDSAVSSPVTRLAERIADQIKTWIDQKAPLVSQGRPIRAADVLILVRKRQPFAPAMVRALKARRIPVAGADRLVLANQIAVQDLMALGDFLTLPEDDLSLASILKSPLCGLDDDDLMQFAPQRKGSLWSALLAAAKVGNTEAGVHGSTAVGNPRIKAAANMLKRWRAFADFAPPFEFFSTLLDRDGCRARFLERLGPDAADPIDEFMNLALTYDDQAPASLQGFLCWVREGRREIKRDMENSRNQVRVMTVHGAKGLEAPIVFLPDTCSAASTKGRDALADLTQFKDAPRQPPASWVVRGASKLEAIAGSRNAKEALEIEEHNRLLYVALTRAQDRLYIAGFEGKKGRGAQCWYDTVVDGLKPLMSEDTDASGHSVLYLDCGQSVPPKTDKVRRTAMTEPQKPPAWAHTPAASEPQLSIPLAPSRLAPLDTDEEGEPATFEEVRAQAQGPSEAPTPSPRTLGHENRFLRGNLTHALLEHLPGQPPESWDRIAEAFVTSRGGGLRRNVRASIVHETLAVLRDPKFADVFGPDSRAEVPIVAEIPPPDGDGLALRLTGQIDRLVRIDHNILILDYKTNRPPPMQETMVVDAYLLQLAAYRLALQSIFPNCTVEAAILWTDGARLMPISTKLLDDFKTRLWELGARRLDAAHLDVE